MFKIRDNNSSPQIPPGAIIIEGHVQGLANTRSLGEAGVPVFVVDTGNCMAMYSKYCKKFFRCPPFNSDALSGFLIELAKAQGIKDWLLLPSNDHAVLTLARNKERLENYFKVITPGLDVIENIYDKSRLLGIAEKIGVPVPGTYYANNANPTNISVAFPVLTRGRFGLDFCKAVGKKAFLAWDIDELRDQLSVINENFSIHKTLTQELIPDDGTNKTISFSAFCVGGEIKAYWMGEKLREHPVRFGTATFAMSVFVKECLTQSIPLLKALNYTGICEVEFLRDPRDGQYKLIELNARTWLWVGLARACGVDFVRMIYAYVHGRHFEYPLAYKIGVKWINSITDASIALKYLKNYKLSFKDYFESLSGKKTFAVFDKKDPFPGVMFFAILPYLLKKRIH